LVLTLVGFVVALLTMGLVIYAVTDRDLKSHGVEVRAIVNGGKLEWVVGRWDETLHYGYTYQFRLNDKDYSFTRWEEVEHHPGVEYKENEQPDISKVNLSQFPIVGDTIKLVVSQVNPDVQEIKKKK
jgi:hypothetical protein